jgi:outer membrane immunogenic protein
MIRRSSICCALLACTAASSAIAADMPAKASPAAAFDWTGIYIGGHIGGGWGDHASTNVTATPFAPVGNGITTSPGGFVGGGQLGGNLQFGSGVLGLEADVSWSGGEDGITVPSPIMAGVSLHGMSDVKWFATLTGRAGYAIDNVLLYVKGGAAWMDVGYTASALNTATGVAIVGPVNFGSVRTGWTAGGGVEHGFRNNWSAKLEYNYLDLGTERYTLTAGGLTNQVDINAQTHVVKLGLNYRLGGTARAMRN